MNLPATLGLFALTALAEIVGCRLVWLWAADGIRPDRDDLLGIALILAGVVVMLAAHWNH